MVDESALSPHCTLEHSEKFPRSSEIYRVRGLMFEVKHIETIAYLSWKVKMIITKKKHTETVLYIYGDIGTKKKKKN